MRINRLSIFVLLTFSLLVSCTSSNEDGIEVTGTAKESIAPDMATFSFSISNRGKDLPILKGEIDKRTAKVVSLCKELGIKTSDIISAEVSIRPQYNYQTNTFINYQVSRNINVVLHDLSKYSELVNGAIKSGITTIGNISLDTKDRDSLERKALGSAISAAKKKAEILALSSDVKIGKVLYVKEGGIPIRVTGYNFRSKGRSENLAQNVFEPGEISVTATVSVRYSIK